MTKRTIILVHGIESDGYGSIFNLAPYFEDQGFTVQKFQYPHNSFFGTFSKTKSDVNAKLLSKLVANIVTLTGRKPHVIFHSNGARVVYRSMEFGARYDQAYAFAPAFSAKKIWPSHGFTKMNVIHNIRDWALWRGVIIPGHEFGGAGAIGYQGPFDKRIHNISNYVKGSVDRNNHSQMWRNPQRLERWAEYLSVRLAV